MTFETIFNDKTKSAADLALTFLVGILLALIIVDVFQQMIASRFIISKVYQFIVTTEDALMNHERVSVVEP